MNGSGASGGGGGGHTKVKALRGTVANVAARTPRTHRLHDFNFPMRPKRSLLVVVGRRHDFHGHAGACGHVHRRPHSAHAPTGQSLVQHVEVLEALGRCMRCDAAPTTAVAQSATPPKTFPATGTAAAATSSAAAATSSAAAATSSAPRPSAARVGLAASVGHAHGSSCSVQDSVGQGSYHGGPQRRERVAVLP